MDKILVTGAAGFIGFHLVERLIKEGNWETVGLNNINDYYDPNLKYARLNETGIIKSSIEYNKFVKSKKSENYRFIKLDLVDKVNIYKLFENEKFDYVVHLAAQAGVRYSLENPDSYIQSNIVGFFHILEASKNNLIKHLIYASSSSVYGLNKKLLFSTKDNVEHPISLYAATKKSNELMAHTYSYLFNLLTTGLRFFTVYGPWGRPDMALFKFVKAIINDEPIEVYKNGNMERDFTYIDDIIESVYRLIKLIPISNLNNIEIDPSNSIAPYKIYNIGNSNPVKLIDFIEIIEFYLCKKAVKNFLPVQLGDVKNTSSDIEDLINVINYKPNINIRIGVLNFIKWYLEYFNYKNQKIKLFIPKK